MARDRSLDVAVTGLSARFPGSSNIDEWWSMLTAGQVLITRYQRGELRAAGIPESLLDDPDYVPARGHLTDTDRFDNTLFGVSPRDAEMLDPQHRLMLETAWAALEDAGRAPRQALPTTGVYASATGSAYLRRMLTSTPLDPPTLEQALHGTEPDFMASFIAYKLGLTGPAIGVQTACSSSLVAVHLAVQALLNGDCDQALVVAAGIDFPQAGHLHLAGGVLSRSGECRPFDRAADGVVAGSGVACVVLRRLADAIEDGPDMYGVILGTAINNDGATRAGYYAPSAAGQEAVIRAALRSAGVDASGIGYLETHGTGTQVGDPIEWSAASAALRGMGAAAGQVAIGALKANVGHLDAAAGVAGLIKALLVVRDAVVPPVAGFTRLNPLLETDDSPLFIPTEAGEWTGPSPRRAAVSSFGIGGTNAQVIVEQPVPRPAAPRGAGASDRLVVLSAADPDALTRTAAGLSDNLAATDPDLADVAFTLAAGRAALPERIAVTGRTGAEIAHRLATGAGVVRGCRPTADQTHAVFLFPGQGAQFPGMAAPLAQALPGFAAALEECLAAFDPATSARLRAAVLDPSRPPDELAATDLAQPALFAVEHAAAVALAALGVTPAAVAGHSLGEITAACLAGVLTLPDAARFVMARGRAMRACPAGAMLAVGAAEPEALDLVAESGIGLELAAVNGPKSCVVAGPPDAVEQFRTWLDGRVHTRILRTSRAFHTSLIEPAIPKLAAALTGIEPGRPRLPFAANATGRLIAPGTEIDPDLFVEQARRPVRFADGLAALAERVPNAVAIEVGPGRTLTALADGAGLTAVALSPAGTGADVLTALGALWTHGQPVDLGALTGGRRIHLPGYPFAGPRWIAPEAAGPAAASDPAPAAQDAEPAPDPSTLLASLWTELLGHADLTEDSDFFQLGGDSLLIMHLARRVNEALGIGVPLRKMLAGRTLGRQTAIVLELVGNER